MVNSSYLLLNYKGREIDIKGGPTRLGLKKSSQSKDPQPRRGERLMQEIQPRERWSKGWMVDRRKLMDAEMRVVLKKYFKRHCLELGTLQ